MPDYKVQLETIAKTVAEKKLEKVKLEERQRKLIEEKAEIQKELEGLGIKPDEVEAWIEREESEIKEGIDKCNQVLSGK